MISGQPLRPLRGMPVKASSSKRNEIETAAMQAKRQIVPGTPKGDRLLYDLHRKCQLQEIIIKDLQDRYIRYQ